jgi:hypothetical protein
MLAICLADEGRDAEAMLEANLEPAEWARLTALAYVHFAAGRRAESDEAIRGLVANHAGDAAYQIAAIYAVRGEADIAFGWMDRGYAQRDSGFAAVRSEPSFRPLHGDPRWNAFLNKMGIAG